MKKIISILLLCLIFVLPIQAQENTVIYLPLLLKGSTVDNNWRIITKLSAQNQILNPSAEIAGNYAATGAAVVSRVTTYQKYGLYSYEVASAGGDGVSLTTATLAAADHTFSIRVRGSNRDRLRVTIGTATKLLTLIEKIDSRWNLYAVGFASVEVSGQTAVEIASTQAETFYVDGVQLEPGPLTTYIDGTQDGCEWLGTAHASISQRSGESKTGGESVRFWEGYNFQIEKVIGAGASSHKLGVDQYAILPGGELNSDKILPREFSIVGQFIADSEPELHDKMADLELALTSTDNQLTRLRFNGSRVQKEIAVRYVGGLEGDMPVVYCDKASIQDDNWLMLNKYTQKAAIQLTAPYPFWQEVGESAAVLDTNDSATLRYITARLRATGQWDDLGLSSNPTTNGTIYDIKYNPFDGRYYIGGDFTGFDGVAGRDYIVAYDPITETFATVGAGSAVTGLVTSIAIAPNGDVYIGGAFLNVADANGDYVAYYDLSGGAWASVAGGGTASVNQIIFGLDGTLYIAYTGQNWGGIGAADGIVSWDGAAYAALGSGVTGGSYNVSALTVALNGNIITGGAFTQMGGVANTARIAEWDVATSTWLAMNTGIADGQVYSLATGDNGLIYVGGSMTDPITRVGQWNGTQFFTLGSGIADGTVYELLYNNGVLYAGGSFTEAGGITLADRGAKWNMSSWAHLDLDLPGSPSVLAFCAGPADPEIDQIYNLFVGFSTTGTGYFAGITTIDNEGTVQAFPKIVYSRSGGTSATLETLRNERNGKEILFDYGLLDGETLTIDLTPTKRSIVSSMFGPRLDAYLGGSDFGQWSLLPNDNDVTSFVAEVGGPTVTSYMLWREAFSSY